MHDMHIRQPMAARGPPVIGADGLQVVIPRPDLPFIN